MKSFFETFEKTNSRCGISSSSHSGIRIHSFRYPVNAGKTVKNQNISLRNNFVNIFANQKNISFTPFDISIKIEQRDIPVTNIMIIHFLSKVNKIDKKVHKKVHNFFAT